MKPFTEEELKRIEVRLMDLLALVRKNIKILNGPDRTWGDIMDKTAKDFNIIHGTNITLDHVYDILNEMDIFDHSKKP